MGLGESRIAKGRRVCGQMECARGEDGVGGDDRHKLRGLIGLGERLGAWVNVGVWKGEDGEDGVGNGPCEG